MCVYSLSTKFERVTWATADKKLQLGHRRHHCHKRKEEEETYVQREGWMKERKQFQSLSHLVSVFFFYFYGWKELESRAFLYSFRLLMSRVLSTVFRTEWRMTKWFKVARRDWLSYTLSCVFKIISDFYWWILINFCNRRNRTEANPTGSTWTTNCMFSSQWRTQRTGPKSSCSAQWKRSRNSLSPP